MLRRYGLAILVLFLGFTVWAQEPVNIEWKFKEGDKFYVENVSALNQIVEANGKKTPVESVSTTVWSFKVLKVEKDYVQLEQKTEASKVKGAKAGLQQVAAEQMVGSVLTITLNGKGEVTKIDGFDGLIKKLAQNKDEDAKLLRKILTEDTIKEGIQDAFAFVPGKPVKKGDTWKRKMSLSAGPVGTLIVDQEYTYEGKGKDGEQIAVKAVHAYQPPKDAGGLPFKITKGEFKTEEAKGVLTFDPVAGRLARYELKAKVKGSLTIEFMGQSSPMQMQQEMNTTIRVLDKWTKE